MPSINDPGALTVQGEAIRAPEADPFQNLETRVPKPAEVAPTQADAALDSGDAIRKSVLSTEGSTDLRDGITVAADPEPKPQSKEEWLASLDPETRNIYDRAVRESEVEAADLAEVKELREDVAYRDFEAGLDEAETAEDVIELLAELRPQVSPEVYDFALGEASELFADDLEGLDATTASLDREAQIVEALKRAIEADRLTQELLPRVAEERAKEVHSLARDFARDIGARSDDEANARIQAAKEFAKNDLGYDLDALEVSVEGWDAKAYDAVLRSADAALHEDNRAQATRRFQQAVADTGDTSIGSGLEVLSPLGFWVRPNEIDLGPAIVDDDRVVQRAQAKRATPQEIRSGILEAPSSSIADGLTDGDGNSTTAYFATGQDRIDKLEREMQSARDRGLLR
jgi:hypothetical protein